jgi:hypothetical protein
MVLARRLSVIGDRRDDALGHARLCQHFQHPWFREKRLRERQLDCLWVPLRE